MWLQLRTDLRRRYDPQSRRCSRRRPDRSVTRTPRRRPRPCPAGHDELPQFVPSPANKTSGPAHLFCISFCTETYHSYSTIRLYAWTDRLIRRNRRYFILIHRFGELQHAAKVASIAWPFQRTNAEAFEAFSRMWNATGATLLK